MICLFSLIAQPSCFNIPEIHNQCAACYNYVGKIGLHSTTTSRKTLKTTQTKNKTQKTTIHQPESPREHTTTTRDLKNGKTNIIL